MSTVTAVVLGKERRMVAAFVARGAVSREQARTLEEVGVQRGLILRRLRERAVIREAAPGHFYVDQDSWTAVRRARRRAVHVAGAVALAILLVLLFGTRRARTAGPSHSAAGLSESRPTSVSRVAGLFGSRPTNVSSVAGLFESRPTNVGTLTSRLL